MKNLEKLFEEAQTELRTMIVFHKAERTFRAAESHVFKDHQLTPTQFSVLETLYSKGDLRIQNLIDSILATSGNMTVVIRNMVRDDGSNAKRIQTTVVPALFLWQKRAVKKLSKFFLIIYVMFKKSWVSLAKKSKNNFKLFWKN